MQQVKPSTVKAASQPAKVPASTQAVTKAAQPQSARKPLAGSKKSLKQTADAVGQLAQAVVAEAKPKKTKLVRDSFTIPKAEFAVLEDLKKRASGLAQPVRKSELLRAGIKALAAMKDDAFKAALTAVPVIKTGRPSKSK